jgi:hypothetical protein
MDRFIIKPRKKDQFYNTSQVVCIYGPIGCGKTTWVKENLDFIEVDEGILKSKETTCEFIERVKYQKRHILVDNFDGMLNLPGAGYFTKPVTKFCTFLVSTYYIEGTVPYKFEGPDYRRLTFSDYAEPDKFIEPSDIVKLHMTNDRPRLELLDKINCEHGNMLGFIHENYTSADPSLDDVCRISLHMSDANITDSHMYDGNWELMPFFVNSACAMTCQILRGNVSTFSQATIWTKHMNACMRMKQFKESRLDLDTVDFMSRTGTLLKFYNIDNKNGKRRRKAKHKVSQQ